MKQFFLLAAFFCTASFAFAQVQYSCEYTDTLNAALTFSESHEKDMRQKLWEQGLSENKIEGIIEQYKKNMKRSFSIVQERKVTVKEDSAFFELQVKESSGQVFLSGRKSNEKGLYAHGEVFRYIGPTEEYVLSENPEDSRLFTSTGLFVNILGYDCEEYQSINGQYKIWVTGELPSSINPGVAVKNVEGAVLGFEFRSDQDAVTRSVAVSVTRGAIIEL